MEKILRRVNIKDGLPKQSGYYHTNIGKLYFDEDGIFQIGIPIVYWYEEVDLDEIITIEKQKYLTELVESFKTDNTLMEKFISSKLFAKERYEKAKQLLDSNQGLGTTELIDKCLLIAAGLK